MDFDVALVHFWLYTCFVHLDSISHDNKNHPDDLIHSLEKKEKKLHNFSYKKKAKGIIECPLQLSRS